jgi:hypothetical protein
MKNTMYSPKTIRSPQELQKLEEYRLFQENKYKNLSPAAKAAVDEDMKSLEKMQLSGDEEAAEFLQLLRNKNASLSNRKKYATQIAEMLSQYNPMYKPATQQQEIRFGGSVGEAYDRIRGMS